MAKTDKKKGGDLGFEAELFKAADKLRGNMEPSDYKHVVLGLIFLKYISDAFDEKHKQLMADDASAAEELRLAHDALGEITGRMTADDLLGRIFSSFCIGK